MAPCLEKKSLAAKFCYRLIINDCLDSGTQFPYIKWARENGYSVIVANPNLNEAEPKDSKKKKPVQIRVSQNKNGTRQSA